MICPQIMTELQARDDTALGLPTLGPVAKFMNGPLLDAGLLKVLAQWFFPMAALCPYPRQFASGDGNTERFYCFLSPVSRPLFSATLRGR
jgi:hypothetical protein